MTRREKSPLNNASQELFMASNQFIQVAYFVQILHKSTPCRLKHFYHNVRVNGSNEMDHLISEKTAPVENVGYFMQIKK